MAINVTRRILVPAREDGLCETHSFHYASHDGLTLINRRSITGESDFSSGGIEERLSPDNGRTWGAWKSVYSKYLDTVGEDEIEYIGRADTWNPVHRHYVGCYFSRFFWGGHKAAYEKLWSSSEKVLFDHQYLITRREGEEEPFLQQLVKYEDGAEFDRNNPRNMDFLDRNRGFLNAPWVASNGDVLMPVGLPMSTACQMAGLDVSRVFPSCPDTMRGVLILRAVWNGERYDMHFSEPIVISDLKSSRGFDEPIVTELSSGRILLVARGSNVRFPAWNTRIEPGTPGFKWHAWSDDGGRTFTEAMPWHFDTGEVVYSSATISQFIRDFRTGRLYWVGNVTGPEVDGNFPRWPLHIAQVDDERGCLLRDTLTVIDTRRDDEPDKLQLSNFGLYQDRETGDFRVTLSKLGQFGQEQVFKSDCMEYLISID